MRRGLLRFALGCCLVVCLPAQCMDAAEDCMAAAMAGECTSNGVYMSVYCKATCGLCGATMGSEGATHFASDDSVLNSVPLMFSGQRLPGDDDVSFALPAGDEAVFVEGADISINLTQPTLAAYCCWGPTAMVRFETTGSLSIPEDGIVVFRFAGEEADIMPFPRGEFQAFVRASGSYALQVAVESHDRSQRFALVDAELVVSEYGPAFVDLELDRAGGASVEQGDGKILLQHALRPHPNASCSVHCMSSDEMDAIRADAAHKLYQRSEQARASRAAADKSGPEIFVVQVGA